MNSVKTAKRVLALGVFDLFHIGHLNYLNFAKQQGDYLIVGVAPDAMCLKSKGKTPIICEQQRMEIIQNLKAVDEVRPDPSPTAQTELALQWLSEWHIDIIVNGEEWQNSERWNRLIPRLSQRNIDVIFAPKTVGISTRDIKQANISS